MTELRTKIQTFLQDALKELKSEDDGCQYMRLDNESGLYLVAAWDDNYDGVRAKIAFNSDGLQSDYNFDWDEPILKSTNDVYDTDIGLVEITLKKDAQWFESNYKILFRLYKNDKLKI